jgi:hypothetical protein
LLPNRSLSELPATLFHPPLYPDEAAKITPVSGGGSSGASDGGGADDGTSPLVAFLLELVADQVVEDVPGMPPVLLGCRSLWRGSLVRCALAAETVVLIRHLAMCAGYEAPLHDGLRASLLRLTDVASSLRSDPSGADLARSGLWRAAKLSLGALCVLGGSLPSLFVGCRVGVEAAPDQAASAADLAERQVQTPLIRS